MHLFLKYIHHIYFNVISKNSQEVYQNENETQQWVSRLTLIAILFVFLSFLLLLIQLCFISVLLFYLSQMQQKDNRDELVVEEILWLNNIRRFFEVIDNARNDENKDIIFQEWHCDIIEDNSCQVYSSSLANKLIYIHDSSMNNALTCSRF